VWYSFTAFKAWAEKQDWVGKQLDKDLLVPGNRVYGPDACCFVPQYINLTVVGLNSDGYVFRANKRSKQYEAGVTEDGRSLWIGSYDTAEEARAAWLRKRAEMIEKAVDRYRKESSPDQRVIAALEAIILKLKPIEVENVQLGK
jgi:hypothetical protein